MKHFVYIYYAPAERAYPFFCAIPLPNVCMRLGEMGEHSTVSCRKKTEDCKEAVALFIMLDKV